MSNIAPGAMTELARSLLDAAGWLGVVLAMAINGTGIPILGATVMPLAGWLLVAEQDLGWPGIVQLAFWGAVGNVFGASFAYWVGARGGRPVVARYRRWLRISDANLDRADSWFARRGAATVLACHLLPVPGGIYISFAAGITRMNFARFAPVTFIGAFLSYLPHTALGYRLGSNWEQPRGFAYPIATVALAALVLAVVVWRVRRQVRGRRDDAGGPGA